jgi:hypothetical protein
MVLEFSELRAGTTYFGDIYTFSGAKIRGFITWDSLNSQFVIQSRLLEPIVTVRKPFGEAARFRFRRLTKEEQILIENQNQMNAR